MKSHNIEICHLLIEASDIKATSMVLNQFGVLKSNVSGVDRVPCFCSNIDRSTTVHCSTWYCILFTWWVGLVFSSCFVGLPILSFTTVRFDHTNVCTQWGL